MNVGFVGLGKLGLPCALAIESKGHTVCGYDISPHVAEILQTKVLPYREVGAPELLAESNITMNTLSEVVEKSDIIFVPIQTPHDKRFEGSTRIPEERKDFDYTYLVNGMKALADEISEQGNDKLVIIISTVLPGTIDKHIKPLLNDHVKLCYNPFFIAMGTCIHDFLHPEFVLFGVDNPHAADMAEAFYRTLHDSPFFHTDVKSAELIKVAYNTYIGMKIVFANTMMEICYHTGANVDAVTEAMGLASDRLMSNRYLSGGMGDGGGCHPRDNIAMSWLAQEYDLSFDFFETLMEGREKQTEWLADMALWHAVKSHLPIYLMGMSFKEQTNICTGSPAILLHNIIEEKEAQHSLELEGLYQYDPHVQEADEIPTFNTGVYVVATKHAHFMDFDYPKGSIVIDPWRYVEVPEGVTLMSLGSGE